MFIPMNIMMSEQLTGNSSSEQRAGGRNLEIALTGKSGQVVVNSGVFYCNLNNENLLNHINWG